MDNKALRYFVTTVQFGSITSAAAHMHVAQPAVSRQIRKLETDLGVRLLNRTAQGVSLTGPGEHLLERGESMLLFIDKIRTEVQNWGHEPSGPVSVALMPAVGSLVAPELVRAVRARHPKVELQISEGLSAFISDGVLRGEFDLGLFHADEQMPLLSIKPLLTEPMFLIGPGRNNAAVRRAISLKQLADYPLLLPSQPNALRRMINLMAEDQGITLDIRENIDSTSIIKRLVTAGLGYTVQCYSYVHEEVVRGDLSIRALKSGELSRDWSLISLREYPMMPAVSVVADIIGEISSGLAKTHHWRPPSN